MSKELPINDPYKPKFEDKFRDIIVTDKPMRKEPFYIPKKELTKQK